MTSRTDEKPREAMFAYVQDRLRMLQTMEKVCGAEAVRGYQREMRVMVMFKNLLEHLEQQEMERAAKAGSRK